MKSNKQKQMWVFLGLSTDMTRLRRVDRYRMLRLNESREHPRSQQQQQQLATKWLLAQKRSCEHKPARAFFIAA